MHESGPAGRPVVQAKGAVVALKGLVPPRGFPGEAPRAPLALAPPSSKSVVGPSMHNRGIGVTIGVTIGV